MKQKRKLPALDYLLIPTGWAKQRENRAFEEIKKREIRNFFILAGCNSEEDILFLGEKLKGNERIGFVTFYLHYLKYKNIIKKAQKQNKFPRGIILENVKTEQTFKQFIYGILALIEEFFDGEVNYACDENKVHLFARLKKIVKRKLCEFP